MSKNSFKEFVRNNQQLIDFVTRKETTWQKLYELYDLYGEDSSIWNKYLKKNNINSNINSNNINLSNLSNNFKEIISFIKGIVLNSVH